jgi:hypothetical protein
MLLAKGRAGRHGEGGHGAADRFSRRLLLIVLGRFSNQQECESERAALVVPASQMTLICLGPDWRENQRRFEFRP